MSLQAARVELKTFLEAQKANFLARPTYEPIELLICQKVDEVVTEVWRSVIPEHADSFALMAVGGYGRGTLHPESDLDILLYFRDAVDEDIVKRVLNPLWDLPFRVGHQIRQASDFRDFDEGQIESYAAFLDDRYLAGSAAVAEEFHKQVFPAFIRRRPDQVLEGLIETK